MAKQRPGTLAGRIRPTNLGEMLRLYRTVRAYSLRDFETITGINHPTLMRIEHGQAIDVQTFFKLWHWLLEEPQEPGRRRDG